MDELAELRIEKAKAEAEGTPPCPKCGATDVGYLFMSYYYTGRTQWICRSCKHFFITGGDT
jgi:ribosomal protein L37AE/L43A